MDILVASFFIVLLMVQPSRASLWHWDDAETLRLSTAGCDMSMHKRFVNTYLAR
jgi:hypothetical protein